jgi:hypothetical protein
MRLQMDSGGGRASLAADSDPNPRRRYKAADGSVRGLAAGSTAETMIGCAAAASGDRDETHANLRDSRPLREAGGHASFTTDRTAPPICSEQA